jgi:hypothetical protein
MQGSVTAGLEKLHDGNLIPHTALPSASALLRLRLGARPRRRPLLGPASSGLSSESAPAAAEVPRGVTGRPLNPRNESSVLQVDDHAPALLAELSHLACQL